MPTTRRNQSNAMLYALITFVFVAVLAIVFAVTYYIKHEDQRTAALQAQEDLSEFATLNQIRDRAKIVGTRKRGETYIGNAIDYVHQLNAMVSGGPVPEDVSAQDMVAQSFAKVQEIVQELAWADIETENFDANTTGLITILNRVNTTLRISEEKVLALDKRFEELQKKCDSAQQISYAKEQELSDEVANYHDQVNRIKQDYDDLQALLTKTTGEQIQHLTSLLQQGKNLHEQTQNELMKTTAKLHATQAKLKEAQLQLRKTTAPQSDVAAFKPDGKIIFVDNQVVHINIGTDDRVYPGLTFAVYDKSIPIPENGRGKAEIRVFDIQKNVAAARIINTQPGTGIVVDDIVANLIWDTSQENIFVIAGNFDLNKDAEPDFDAFDRLKTMIDKWGGKTADMVSIDTDFVILGNAPPIIREPSQEDLEVDPMATQKYEAAKQRHEYYNQVRKEAEALWVPVFNTDRFLYFIGYKTLSAKPDAL